MLKYLNAVCIIGMKYVVMIFAAILVMSVGINKTFAESDDLVMEKIVKAIKDSVGDGIDDDKIEEAATAIMQNLKDENVQLNEDASIIAKTEPGSINTLVCVSNNGFPVPSVGMEVHCATFTNDPSINDKHIKVIKPDNTVETIFDDDITVPDVQTFSITMDQAGHWQVVVDFTQDGKVIIDLEVNWFVLPEAPIGAIAIIGSSIAVVSLYGLK
ncbi:MAG: hypothetical protein D6752_05845, partial [Candidatus Nitrosothermus koennekii]